MPSENNPDHVNLASTIKSPAPSSAPTPPPSPTEAPIGSNGKNSMVSGLLKNKLILFAGGGFLLLIVLLVGLLLAQSLNPTPGGIVPTPTPSEITSPISANGKVAFLRGADVYLTQLSSINPQKIGSIPLLQNNPNKKITKLDWSSDGRLIAFVVEDTQTKESILQVMQIADGVVLDVLATTLDNPIYDFAWIPNSLEVIIAYASTERIGPDNVQKYYLGKLSVLGFPGTKQFLDWVRPFTQLQVSGSGYIYFLDENHEIWRVALSGGRFLPVLRGVATFDISPDGAKIAFERAADGEIWVSNENGGNPKQLTFTSKERQETYGKGGRSLPRWSLDNRTILFTESGANFKGLGLINENGTGLRSVEENNISPKIKYNEFYDRSTENATWISNTQIIFVGKVDDRNLKDNLYVITSTDGSYQLFTEDGQMPIWNSL